MAKATKAVAKDINALKAQRDELALEAEIAQLRADIVEANTRRLKAQQDFAQERAKIK